MSEYAAAIRSPGLLGTIGNRLLRVCDRNASWLMPLPAMVATALLMFFPLAYLLYMSLHSWLLLGSAEPAWVGLQNYQALLQDDRFIHALERTGIFIGLGLVVQVPLGVGIALLFNEEFPARGLMRTLLLLPMVATPVAMALVWVMMLDPTAGVLDYFLSLAGVRDIAWLSDPTLVVPALVMVDTWEWTPMVALICLAGLAALPSEPFEAAMIDGASRWRRFWSLTLPMVWPTLLVAILFRFIDLLKVIDIIYVMTRGGPGYASETINVYNFLVGLFYYRVGYGAAISVVIFALVLGMSLVLIRARRVTW